MDICSEAQTSVFTVLAVTSWSLVEVPRYLFYALNIVGLVPYPLFWLRYSLFAILYPTGISGELGCFFRCGEFLYKNKSNPALFWALVAVAATYGPGSPKMYGHMVKTRRKQFAELDKVKAA
jgi:very-long-chain (3R)-3-hydroxyacyl-CoA dehydratase